MRHDAFFFFGLLLFIFLVWAATGGPTRPISFAGPFINPPAPLGDGQAYFLSGAGFHIGGEGSGLSIGSGSSHLSIDGGSSSSADESFFTNASPYRGEVQFYSGSSDPKQSLAVSESVTVRAASDAPENGIVITGWKLVSTASTGTIGSGTLVPSNGSVNGTAPITLLPGEKAVVTSGRSPIGVSFRENECTGYLDQYQGFYPSLQKSCPSARNEYEDEIGDVDSDAERDCGNFLSSLNRCEITTRFPKDSDGNQELSSACRNFVGEQLTYNACVSNHRGDDEFAGDTWRVFLGSAPQLWRDTHDTIRLLDAQGRTVDVFQY